MTPHPFASAAYARLFGAVAEPLWVEPWGTHVLVRPIAGSDRKDGIGCYPLTVFGEGADIASGLAWLKARGLVSVGLTPDPLTSPPREVLAGAFPLCVPYKTHLLVDHRREVKLSKHHRYEVKRAEAQVETREVALADHLEGWIGLYRELAARRGVSGLSDFTPDAFAKMARLDGLRTVAAFAEEEVLSMHLWIIDETRRVGHSLLAASSAEGYRRNAAYAVYAASIDVFSGIDRLHLGGGAGLAQDDADGLFRFKRGFANAETPALFCGAVLDADAYVDLSGGAAAAAIPFPAYRFPRASAP